MATGDDSGAQRETAGGGASSNAASVAQRAMPPPLKAAAWEEKAAGVWCPDMIQPFAPAVIADLEYKDSEEKQDDGFEGWRVLAATRRGRMHAHRGTHREDALAVGTGERHAILCVSDGAGAYPHSRIGSEITVRVICGHLRDWFANRGAELEADDANMIESLSAAMLEGVKLAIQELSGLAEKSGCPAKDFRCTLLLAVAYQGREKGFIRLCQVGDGFFARVDRSGAAHREGSKDSEASGDYSGQVKCFIPDPDAEKYAASLFTLEMEDVEALIIGSDGIEDPFFPIHRHAGKIFQQLDRGVAEKLDGFEMQRTHGPVLDGGEDAKKRLADWLAFEKRGENDDRTIIVLRRCSKTGASAPPSNASALGSV